VKIHALALTMVVAVSAAYAAPLPLPDYTYPAHICDVDLITTHVRHVMSQQPFDQYRFGSVLYVRKAEEIARSRDELRCRVDLRTTTTEHLYGVFRWINEEGYALVKFEWNNDASR
jgi:hypothetical protein